MVEEEQRWSPILDFLDYIVEEGVLDEYIRENNLKVHQIDLLQSIHEKTFEGRDLYLTLFKENLLPYHRWRQRKGLEY